jgi:hypothetical protein
VSPGSAPLAEHPAPSDEPDGFPSGADGPAASPGQPLVTREIEDRAALIVARVSMNGISHTPSVRDGRITSSFLGCERCSPQSFLDRTRFASYSPINPQEAQ